jgi:hypothetical protein
MMLDAAAWLLGLALNDAGYVMAALIVVVAAAAAWAGRRPGLNGRPFNER